MGGQSTSSGAGTRKAFWPSFLRGESASELLGRMLESDPLRLRESSARRLREVWFLLEPDRVFHRTLAVVADAARCDDPPEDLAAWAATKIDLAIEQLVREDRAAETAHPGVLTEEEQEFPLLTDCFFLEPGLVRAVSVAFNSLDALPRRAFFELVILGREVPEVVEAGPWDEEGLHHAFQTALATMSLDARSESPDPQPERSDE